ncbi:MAG TPA: hypothetical protein EYP73_04085 [Acidimicrobiia bacterium]|nr:hypothetical protein [Acidimicrobiia bacterium]
MSPRAACRLEGLGFERVYDYVAGIADWKAAGLPVEGKGDGAQRVADAFRTDIPSCDIETSVGTARTLAFDSDWEECVVTDCDGVVVGRLRDSAWDADDALPVEEVMESGPSTVRPDALLQPLLERMGKRGTRLVLVTTPQGHLLGALLREEAERLAAAGEPPEQSWQTCECCPGRWTVKTG